METKYELNNTKKVANAFGLNEGVLPLKS
ncbi:capsid morphogenesis B protein, partial [Staphylococcus aureus]